MKKEVWASEIRELLETDYPNVKKIILVCDNLNTHTIGAFYAAFPPAEASQLLKRLEIYHTPKHASWLNIAEIELSALSRQCQDRRLDNLTLLLQEIKNGSPPEITTRNRSTGSLHLKMSDQIKTALSAILIVPIHSSSKLLPAEILISLNMDKK